MKIDDNSIKPVSSFKHLGVVLDATLNWKSHLNYIISRGNQRFGMLLRRVREKSTMNAVSSCIDVSYVRFLIIHI